MADFFYPLEKVKVLKWIILYLSSPRATGVTLMGRRMSLATTGDTVGLGQHIRQQRGGVARGQGAWILLSGPDIRNMGQII